MDAVPYLLGLMAVLVVLRAIVQIRIIKLKGRLRRDRQ